MHMAPVHPMPTFICNIHSTVTGSLAQVTINKRAHSGLSMEVISDTDGNSVPR